MERIKIREKYVVDLINLFEQFFKEKVEDIEEIKSDGSSRKIIRLKSSKRSVVGVYGPDKLENNAFIYFSGHFRQFLLPVPEIFVFNPANKIYLETDLGNETLFDFLMANRHEQDFDEKSIFYYKRALKWLALFQTQTIKDINLKNCYPRAVFDRQSIMWDLNYFKYHFLKLAGIPFNEQKLENDFNAFADFLIRAKSDYFLYRDFQSRNIMIKDGETWFIDYQGGRKGVLQYDVASLLYDAKADIKPELRKELLKYYLSLPEIQKETSPENFMEFYYPYTVIRLMQAMGAYGFRGFFEKKSHFLQSVPYVIKNLEWLIENTSFLKNYSEILKVFKKIISSTQLRQLTKKKLGLNLKIYSFSYKNGIPQDYSGHNGGFVFDCRCLPNPAKEEKYKNLTGKDPETIKYLDSQEEVQKFFEKSSSLIEQAVENYLGRNFTDLSVCFGCTGGIHRSVYMAEKTSSLFKGRSNISVILRHLELKNKKIS